MIVNQLIIFVIAFQVMVASAEYEGSLLPFVSRLIAFKSSNDPRLLDAAAVLAEYIEKVLVKVLVKFHVSLGILSFLYQIAFFAFVYLHFTFFSAYYFVILTFIYIFQKRWNVVCLISPGEDVKCKIVMKALMEIQKKMPAFSKKRKLLVEYS